MSIYQVMFQNGISEDNVDEWVYKSSGNAIYLMIEECCSYIKNEVQYDEILSFHLHLIWN